MLLEIDDAMTAMGANVKRYALRDATIFPNTPEGSAKQRELQQKTQTWQREHMWNQLEASNDARTLGSFPKYFLIAPIQTSGLKAASPLQWSCPDKFLDCFAPPPRCSPRLQL